MTETFAEALGNGSKVPPPDPEVPDAVEAPPDPRLIELHQLVLTQGRTIEALRRRVFSLEMELVEKIAETVQLVSG